MPTSEYEWLTDRERAFLDDPESVGPQEAAEIRYRIRTKYETTVDALNTLSEKPTVWDKKGEAFEASITCTACLEEGDATQYRYELTDEKELGETDWHNVEWVNGTGWYGWCPDCWEEYRDDEMVVEQGRIPCSGLNCSTHQFTGKARKECQSRGNIPYSDEELGELRREYDALRSCVCPECRTPLDELEEGEFEYEWTDIYGDTEIQTGEGFLCDCGWKGFKNQLRYIKTRTRSTE